MLIINRREGEEIVIGDPRAPLGIIRIASINGSQVKVALEFPKEIPVNRREIAEEIINETEEE